jgi:hypothetical protein
MANIYFSDTQIYIALAIVILAILAGSSWISRKKEPARLSELAALAFGLVIAGIVFGENRALGYSLMGAGVLLAVVDIIRKRQKPHQ